MKPDLFITGPAYNAGRYGSARAYGQQRGKELGIPTVTGMYPRNQQHDLFIKIYIAKEILSSTLKAAPVMCTYRGCVCAKGRCTGGRLHYPGISF